MKVYVLTVNMYKGYTGADINLFGVFSSKELAEKKAKEIGWPRYGISEVDLDQPVEIYLGGYFIDDNLVDYVL